MPSITYICVCLSQFILKYTKSLESSSQAKPIPSKPIPFYWKTSAATNHVPDYWNHGPIFIPGYEKVFTMTTKKPDIFPPWLTRTNPSELFSFPFKNLTTIRKIMHKTSSTEASTVPETFAVEDISSTTTTTEILTDTESITGSSPEVPMLTEKEAYTTSSVSYLDLTTIKDVTRFQEEVSDLSMNPVSESTKITRALFSNPIENSPKIYDETTHKKQFKRKATTTVSTTSRTLQSIAALEDTAPFSLFLRNFLGALSLKSLTELSTLVDPFLNYMTQILVSGKLSALGVETNLYLTKMVRDINKAPDVLHKNVNEASKMVANRFVELAADMNDLLDSMDDMYDEAEEESMQVVLKLITLFPNSNRTAEEIVQSFVNDLFLHPMHRVSGTWKGNILFNIITDVVKKRISIERRFLKNSQGEYKFLMEPHWVDKYVKYKAPHTDKSRLSDVNTYDEGNFRRNLFFSSYENRRAVSSEVSSYEERNWREKSYDDLKYKNRRFKKILKPNILKEDSDEIANSNDSEMNGNTSKYTENSFLNSCRNSHVGKISKYEAPSNKTKSRSEQLRTTVYNRVENIKRAARNTIISFTGHYIRSQERRYGEDLQDKIEKHDNRRHTILLPAGNFGTQLIRDVLGYDIPNRLYGDKHSQSRNVINNQNDKEKATKPSSKLALRYSQNAMHSNHFIISDKAKENRPFHQQIKFGQQNKIKKYTFPNDEKPTLKQYDLRTPTTRAYYSKFANEIKAPYKSGYIYKNNEVTKTIANNKNKETAQGETTTTTISEQHKEMYLIEKGGMSENHLYSEKRPIMTKKKTQYPFPQRHIIPELPKNSGITFPNQELKLVTKPFDGLKNHNSYITFSNKPFTIKRMKGKGLFIRELKPVSQKISLKIFSTKTLPYSQFSYDKINSKQPYHAATLQTNKQTNNEKKKYNTKTILTYITKNTNNKKRKLTNATVNNKNKNITQDSSKHTEKKLNNSIELIYDDDESTNGGESSTEEESFENSDEIIVKNATRLPGVTQISKLSKLNSKANMKIRKSLKHRHRHKNRHKKSKHRKHGHKRSHYSRKKYEKLKRKYRKLKRLKDLIIRQRQLYANRGETSFPLPTEQTSINLPVIIQTTEFMYPHNIEPATPGITKTIERSGVANEYDYNNPKSEESYPDMQMEIAPENGHDGINLLMDDYDASVNADGLPDENALSTSRREIGAPKFSVINAKHTAVKGTRDKLWKTHINNTNMKFAIRPRSNTVNMPVFNETAYNDEEFQLKQNLYDAFRHMDFNKKHFNISRRNMKHGASVEVLQNNSYETDLEAVLKRNIYKAVKKLLKK